MHATTVTEVFMVHYLDLCMQELSLKGLKYAVNIMHAAAVIEVFTMSNIGHAWMSLQYAVSVMDSATVTGGSLVRCIGHVLSNCDCMVHRYLDRLCHSNCY